MKIENKDYIYFCQQWEQMRKADEQNKNKYLVGIETAEEYAEELKKYYAQLGYCEQKQRCYKKQLKCVNCSKSFHHYMNYNVSEVFSFCPFCDCIKII